MGSAAGPGAAIEHIRGSTDMSTVDTTAEQGVPAR
jgi:hypothetical protein